MYVNVNVLNKKIKINNFQNNLINCCFIIKGLGTSRRRSNTPVHTVSHATVFD